MIYITGDIHRNFDRIEDFCREHNTTTDDILIILGDAGINYYCDSRDRMLKDRLIKNLPITLFCIHGNHEERPQFAGNYKLSTFAGGIVYKEDDVPNLMFAIDAQVYKLNNQNCLVIGGAYSVDKEYRLEHGLRWFASEQPSLDTKANVIGAASTVEYKYGKLDCVLSHTCPAKYIPTEMFLGGIDQSTVDRSTEDFLDDLESRVKYDRWFCGHWHTDKTVNKIRFLFTDIIEFPGGFCADDTNTSH